MKFSICIPAYKAKFLEECIKSILCQTVTDFELIILNDCSPEPIEEIVQSFSDSRIVYTKNSKNVGALNLVHNWNKCLDMSNSEFLIIMGDDDRLEPNYLEEFQALINQYPLLDVYHCRSKIIDDNGNDIILTPALPQYESIYDNIWHRISGRRLQYISDFIYRVSALKEKGGFHYFPLAWGTDDVTAFIACGNKGIAHTNIPVFNYRRNQLSISSTGNIIEKFNAYHMYIEWLGNFLKNSPLNSSDLIIYNDLKDNYKKYINKKQQFMLTEELKKKTLRRGVKMLLNRKRLKFSSTQILYSMALNLGRKVKK